MASNKVFRRKKTDRFSDEFSSRISHKHLVYTKGLKKDGDVLCLSVYMVPLIP